MSSDLAGKRIAFLVANIGVAEVELTRLHMGNGLAGPRYAIGEHLVTTFAGSA
ncbi:MAG: hypothetical protein ACR2KJ_08870 [Jatrophihabitans sp.]